MPNNYREVRESSPFGRQKAKLGDIRRLDEALDGFVWMVCRGPEEFPSIHPDSRVRVAEVGPLKTTDGQLQNYMILFRIETDGGVELLWIESIKI